MKNIFFFILMALSFSLSAWSQTPQYKVYAIKFASMAHPSAISDWADKGPEKDSINIDFMIWLIKGNSGRNILVDAGFLKDIEEAKDFGIANYVRPDSMLPGVALKAGDITDIILSHPHWDHIDGMVYSQTLIPGFKKKTLIILLALPGKKMAVMGDLIKEIYERLLI